MYAMRDWVRAETYPSRKQIIMEIIHAGIGIMSIGFIIVMSGVILYMLHG